MEGLRIQALYPVSELARVMGVSHRRLQKLLESSEVYVMRAGRFLYVPLTELEEKSLHFGTASRPPSRCGEH
jgi:hypothetical protein